MTDLGPFSLPPPTPEERKRALEDPGPSWREWVYGSMLKIYIPLGFLIADTWIVGAWVEPFRSIGALPAAVGAIASVAPALYGEYVLFEYLYARPPGDPSRSVREEFRPTVRRPFQYGRWTPAGRRVRAGRPPYESPHGGGQGEVDPSEFF